MYSNRKQSSQYTDIQSQIVLCLYSLRAADRDGMCLQLKVCLIRQVAEGWGGVHHDFFGFTSCFWFSNFVSGLVSGIQSFS